jgi:hypothetical protein
LIFLARRPGPLPPANELSQVTYISNARNNLFTAHW